MNKKFTCSKYEEDLGTAKELVEQVKNEMKAGRLAKRKLVWLELTGCSGNIISLLDGNNPDFKYLIAEMVDLVYDNSLMVQEGENAIEKIIKLSKNEFILAVEGAVATKNNGLYNIIGKLSGKPFTAFEAIKSLGEKASHVIAVGACAVHGGVSAAKPNPSDSVSVQSLLERKVIKLPGCPCHPDWFLGTLAYILLYGDPKLDTRDRPIMFYGTLLHDNCSRRSFFEKGIFAQKLGEKTCMFKLGCRGPVTRIDCPIRQWNEYVNWPIKDDTPCIGCAQFGFPDQMEPFISFDTTKGE